MRLYYEHHGAERVPVDAFAFWNHFRDALDPNHENMHLSKPASSLEEASLEEMPLLKSSSKIKNYQATSYSESSSDSEKEDRESLSPQDKLDLEEAAAKYHNEHWPQAVKAVASVQPLPKPREKKKVKLQLR